MTSDPSEHPPTEHPPTSNRAGTAPRTPCAKLEEDPNWQPYCLKCETMGRMTRMSYGFKCYGIGDYFGRRGCGNTIGVDMRHIDPEAP